MSDAELRHRGTAFGLHFVSELALPELSQHANHEADVDVTIRVGFVPRPDSETAHAAQPAGALFQGSPTELMLRVPNIAAYHVTANEVVVEPAPGADDASVRLFLMGSAIGACLHLRGLCSLHGSAVVLPDGTAAVFCGVSTAGKSTLATALSQRGHQMLADDISAIRFDGDGKPWCMPGLSRTKLWEHALTELGLTENASPERRVRPAIDKYLVEQRVADCAVPVSRVYELRVGERADLAFTPLSGVDKLNTLVVHTFRPRFPAAMGLQAQHLQRLMRLAPRLHMARIDRPKGRPTLPAIVEALEAAWRC